MIDLDHFRLINERFGYLAGDLVLREVAQRIHQAIRACDVVGRYGADEFVILSPEITNSALIAQAERVLTSLSTKPVCFDGQEILLTACVGVAIQTTVHQTNCCSLPRMLSSVRSRRAGTVWNSHAH
ncbi:MAG: hypothetical protein NVS9B15_09310 [Acidobacteriaceae bacterium]